MPRDQRIATSVDESTKREFRIAAAEQDKDMSELLRELVLEYLEERGSGNAIRPIAEPWLSA